MGKEEKRTEEKCSTNLRKEKRRVMLSQLMH